jgi:hypothetical protein
LIFEVGGGRSFLKIEGENEAHSTRVQRRRLLLQAPVWRRLHNHRTGFPQPTCFGRD